MGKSAATQDAAARAGRGVVQAPLTKQLQELRDRVADGEVPGFAQLLIRRGRVVHRASHGFADMERGVRFSEQTLVRLFSMTKPLTTVALMMLVEQGQVSLDKPVGAYLPCFKNLRWVGHANRVAATEADRGVVRNGPTIRQLLMHTSGISYGTYFGSPERYACEKAYKELVHGVDTGSVSTLKDFVEKLSKLSLRFEPTTRWEYSHGLDVLGRVIEVVSGRSLDEFLQERLFKPLGMRDTTFSVPRGKVSRLSALYKLSGTDSKKLQRMDGGPKSAWVEGRQCRVLAGGGFMGSRFPASDGPCSVGGLVSTLRDQARFLLMLRNGGKCSATGARILSEATVKSLFQNWLTMPSVAGGQRRIKGWHDSGRGWMGWGPLGQVSLGEGPTDIWMGGIAGTFWAMDRKRDLISIHVMQVAETYDHYGNELWNAAKELYPLPGQANPQEGDHAKEHQEEEGDKHQAQQAEGEAAPPAKRRRRA